MQIGHQPPDRCGICGEESGETVPWKISDAMHRMLCSIHETALPDTGLAIGLCASCYADAVEIPSRRGDATGYGDWEQSRSALHALLEDVDPDTIHILNH